MSEREQNIKEWNAVSYLRDFINVDLRLSPDEQAVWDYLLRQNAGAPNTYFNTPTKPRKYKNVKYRVCIRCNEIKPVSEFEGRKTVCKECRRQEQLWKQHQ